MTEIIIYRGDTADIHFTILAPDGSNQDLTGAVAEWKLGPMGSNAQAIVTKTTGSGIETNGNVLIVSLSASDTQDLQPKTHTHQLRITFANGSKKTVYRGPIALKNLF